SRTRVPISRAVSIVSTLAIGTCSSLDCIDEFAQLRKPDELIFEAREARVEAARVREDEDARIAYGLLLDAGACAARFAEEIAIDAESDECDDFRLDARDLLGESLLAAIDLVAR